jgi:superfamily II RNA helicase
MVVICDKPCTNIDGSPYEIEYDGKQLSEFQKWAIKSIKEGNHVLITAHTGSGKTLPAEFAIQYFTSPERGEKKKKVIYASPIKALSNQKLFDFRRKFPNISFGILTGDCKDNPDADVVIMTTEILRNTLLQRGLRQTQANADTVIDPPFNMNFDTELAAVVFDEVHYINDAERGSVWEQAILLLPPQVQLIMLSATIDRPEEFAGWIETEKQAQMQRLSINSSDCDIYKQIPTVYLASTNIRIVPLTHYIWLSIHESTIKKAAMNKTNYEKKLEELRKNLIPIASSDGVFREDNYYKVKDITNYLHKNNIYTKRQFVLEDLLKYLKNNEMLPAICFVFSRKHVELAAKEITFSLFDDDSELPLLIEKECRHILQSKLANYQDYIALPEYLILLGLLQKGIAIHHAGIIPVLREMVELLFEKKFIRLLIATETFAVGLNMPTKTVIFAGLTKYNGNTMRLLFPHEYTQMAGRAGRRGIDTIGRVIHCVNLFDMPTSTEYKHMLTGPPQTLTSKFKISFTMALSMLNTNQDIMTFMEQSLLSTNIKRDIKFYISEENKARELVEKRKEQLLLCRTPVDVLTKYKTLEENIQTLTNSARKKARIELNNIEAEYKFITADVLKLNDVNDALNDVQCILKDKNNTIHYIENNIVIMKQLLYKNEFITELGSVCDKGRIASTLQEVHPLAMSELYYKTNGFNDLDASQLATLFSCFYPLSVNDEVKSFSFTSDIKLSPVINSLEQKLNYYFKQENELLLDSGSQYELQYDLCPFVLRWCYSIDENECKSIIRELKENTGIFLGEFIKALLKINAIAQEFEKVCELTQNIALLEKMRTIPHLTLKYIATNQSLYL